VKSTQSVPRRQPVWSLALGTLLAGLALPAAADEAADLGKVEPNVLSKEQRRDAAGMIDRDINRRTTEANARNREEWSKIKTREQWEKYRDERIARLRRSLGDFPPPPEKLNVKVTGIVEGDGFKIENVMYESRPGQWVTGNLYVPAKPPKSMPGILIAHAHHRDKPERELQDMGMTWARAGCLVLVIDQVGYGERRSHPFNRAEDFPKPYRTSRQDYFFRYDSGVQLQLLGDSLMGWFAWDLSRGVDLLLARPGIDPKRIIILGAVAGGGDPAAVTAALDRRITCCVPFNFGGPQPETRYPLPDDAEISFNYLGGTYWDSTRGLRLGGRDDFPHWVIVASTAPHYLIHGHEFSWDKEHDPVWKRYEKIWGDFYGVADHLGYAHGKGLLKLRPPQASHCTNIGKFHRQMIHPLFDRWFGIKVKEEDEYSSPRKTEELICLTDKARQELKPKSLTELMSALGTERIEKARKRLDSKTADERRKFLRDDWSKLLGPVNPAKMPGVQAQTTDAQAAAGAKVERIVLEVEPGIVVPVVLLTPAKRNDRAPVVIGLAQAGKAGFLKERANELQKLVQGGAIVVLPDTRGTGETRSGSSRGSDSNDTNLSTHEQLFGETLLGERLRDLRSVISYMRSRKDVDTKRLALWGDSFAPPNPAETNFKLPRGVEGWPQGPEPLGGLLALLGALFEDDVRAIYLSGGLTSYHSVLTNFAVLIPHDASVPGALTAGDLCDLAAALAPRPLRLEAMTDHLNRLQSATEVKKAYAPAVQRYSAASGALSLADKRSSAATWLLEQLK
jgi:cephalosporin-C deacetylase-like acetyl esterase